MTPRFTIVVPCYRVSRHRLLVEQCVASIAQQDFTDYEVLLVDDGSPDATAEILAQILNAHPALLGRGHVVSLPENGGVCAARNAGIDAARGEYIAFLDFDDLWQPSYLSHVHEAIVQHPETPVFLVRTDFMRTMGAALRVHSTGSIGQLNALDSASFHAWHLLNNFPVGMGSASVVARRLYGEQPDLRFDLALTRTTAEDVLFGFQLLARGIRPWYVDKPLCVARRSMDRMSRGTAAFLLVDERQVNHYIAERATSKLVRKVVAERPELASTLAANRDRIEREFVLKREYCNFRDWFGLRSCLRDPRGFKTLARLVGSRLLTGSALEFLLHRYYFHSGGDDAQARARVQALVRTVSPAAFVAA